MSPGTPATESARRTPPSSASSFVLILFFTKLLPSLHPSGLEYKNLSCLSPCFGVIFLERIHQEAAPSPSQSPPSPPSGLAACALSSPPAGRTPRPWRSQKVRPEDSPSRRKPGFPLWVGDPPALSLSQPPPPPELPESRGWNFSLF